MDDIENQIAAKHFQPYAAAEFRAQRRRFGKREQFPTMQSQLAEKRHRPLRVLPGNEVGNSHQIGFSPPAEAKLQQVLTRRSTKVWFSLYQIGKCGSIRRRIYYIKSLAFNLSNPWFWRDEITVLGFEAVEQRLAVFFGETAYLAFLGEPAQLFEFDFVQYFPLLR